MRHYCTYFDSHYLGRARALHASLRAHAGAFKLHVLGMDEDAERVLRAEAWPDVEVLPLAGLLARHPALAAARSGRTALEFYFTCTSWLMRDLLPQMPAGELLTYLDADLYFFGSPQPAFDEIGAASVAITPHRFPASLVHLERYGRFNVGWVSFRHDATGLACAADWADRCAAWCFNRLDADRYADQKYLDAWATRFPGTVSLQHPGVNAAPWNIKDCVLTAGPRINGQPLVFYHFHALAPLGRQLFDAGLHRYDAAMTPGLREFVYLPYLRQLAGSAATDAPDLLPPADPADPRAGLALAPLLEKLRASELDRAQRLEAYFVMVADRDRAQTQLETNVAYLQEVQKDSDARLASIQFHQDKLKQAYADHAHNVAYIERLHAEIAAHVKVAEDHGRIIAELNEKLRAALERP